jgi:hypothetical protein
MAFKRVEIEAPLVDEKIPLNASRPDLPGTTLKYILNIDDNE